MRQQEATKVIVVDHLTMMYQCTLVYSKSAVLTATARKKRMVLPSKVTNFALLIKEISEFLRAIRMAKFA